MYTEGSDYQAKLRSDTATLMDDDWWAGSTGATVAVEIKGFTDLVNDAISIFVPEGQMAQMGASVLHHAPEIARTVTGVGVLVTYTKENAKAASIQGGAELFARYGGPIGTSTKLLLDAADYAKNKKEAEEYRETVQDQVRRINETLKTLDEKRKASVQNMDAYQEIVTGIDMMCATASIAGPPQN